MSARQSLGAATTARYFFLMISGSATCVAQGSDSTTTSTGPKSIFERLQVEIKNFTAKNTDESALGVAFAYERPFTISEKTDKGVPASALAGLLRSRGNVSFDPDVAPNSMVEVKGGLDGTWFLRSDVMTPAERELRVALDLQVHAGFESNQRFTARNSTYGATLLVSTQAGPEHWLAGWNPLDVPFRLTRWLSGYRDLDDVGNRLINRADALPALGLTVEQVQSAGADPRQAAGDTSDFVRLSGEAVLSAAFLRLRDVHVAAEVSYRAFYEPGASRQVRTADLDFYDYFVIALKVSADEVFGKAVQRDDGIVLSYRSGQLPFDRSNADVFELGFRVHF